MDENVIMQEFLKATCIVDWNRPEVISLARSLASPSGDPVETAGRCFEWVRDRISHTMDAGREEVTRSASDVLRAGTGFCYAKSHLLAALLRANGIPAGFVYQRLTRDGAGPPFCLHGLNAIHLPEIGWLRVDARGNRPGIHARFDPPREFLAFPMAFEGERLLPEIHPRPLPVVLRALTRFTSASDLAANPPDLAPEESR